MYALPLVIAMLLICTLPAHAQKVYERYEHVQDSVRIGPTNEDFLTCTQVGYTLILPEKPGTIHGVIISLEDSRIDFLANAKETIHLEATQLGYAVLYLSSGIPVDLYLLRNSLKVVDDLISTVFGQYNLPKRNIFFLGVNLAGHRALKYIIFAKQNNQEIAKGVKGFVLCDGVLDWVRQWYEGKKGIRDNFAESAVFEGKLVTYLLETNLNGSPKTNLEAYLDFSVYSYFDDQNRYVGHYRDYAFRAYSEPATNYWLSIKGKTTFDTNFPDMVGIINELRLAGNTRAELIVFQQSVSNLDRRNPNYTWSLVDKTELMQWIVSQSE